LDRDQNARNHPDVAKVGQKVRIVVFCLILTILTKGSLTAFLCRKSVRPGPRGFAEPVDDGVKRFTASVGFDRRLAKYDIAGSRAHARMLAARGILSRRDLAAIQRGLNRIDVKSTPGASAGRSMPRTCT
jgi:hypothetical protein